MLFLEKCRERKSDINIAQDLSELLGLTIDSVYRRLRGETSLTFMEIMKICHHYKISYDAAINFKSKYVPFQFNTMFREKFEIVNYLKGLSSDLESMSMDPNIRIVMTAMDLPYFRQFGFKSLSRFKLFFLQLSVLNLPYYRHMKFDWKTKIDEFEDIT